MTALGPVRAIWTDRALRLVALAFLCHGTFASSLVPYRSLLGVEWFGLSDGTFALIYAAGAALSLAMPLRRLGEVRLIAAAAVVFAAFLALFPLLAPLPAVWVLPFVAALGAGVILTVPVAYLQNLMGERPGAGGSLVALCNLAAQILGAAVFALGSWVAGYGTVAVMGAVMVASGGIALFLADRVAGPRTA